MTSKTTNLDRALAANPPKTVLELREVVDAAALALNVDLPAVGALHDGVVFRSVGGEELTADVIVPAGSGPFAVLVFLHGGAWVAGSTRTHRKLACRFAEQGFLVISPDYRVAPETPFPGGLYDCLHAIRWASAHASRWGGDPSRLLLFGDSAGANLAAAALVTLRDVAEGPRVHAAALFYGYFDYTRMQEEARERPSEDRRLGQALNEAYFGTASPDRTLTDDPRVSPIRAAEKLPPVFLLCGTEDYFYPQNVRMAARLEEIGADFRFVAPEGMPHGFVQMEGAFPEALDAVRMAAAFLKARLP